MCKNEKYNYWENPFEYEKALFGDDIIKVENDRHSEMYYDFNDDDRPIWLYFNYYGDD